MTFSDIHEKIETVQPSVNLQTTWNFERPDAFPSTGNFKIEAPEFSSSLDARLTMHAKGGVTGSFNVGYSGLGSDVSSWTFGARLTVPLAGNE